MKFIKNKEEAIEYIKQYEYTLKIDEMPLQQYVLNNYKPWFLKITDDKTEIHKSCFPDQNRDSVTGEFFGLYPSLPPYPPEGLKYNGIDYSYDEFDIIENFPGTGGSLITFNKKHKI
jgi:hypothetical protein